MRTMKTFDCLKMKDEAQQLRAERLAGLTSEQRLAVYRREVEALRQRQAEALKRLTANP